MHLTPLNGGAESPFSQVHRAVSPRQPTMNEAKVDHRPLHEAVSLVSPTSRIRLFDTLYPNRGGAILVKNTISRDDTIGKTTREAAGFSALGRPAGASFLRDSIVSE